MSEWVSEWRKARKTGKLMKNTKKKRMKEREKWMMSKWMKASKTRKRMNKWIKAGDIGYLSESICK